MCYADPHGTRRETTLSETADDHIRARIRKLRCFIVLPIALLALGLNAIGQCTQACPEQRTITVNAVATATTDADLAVVHVGYRIFGPDAKTAYATASDVSNGILHALTASGVRKSDIESTNQFLQRTSYSDLQQMTMVKPGELAQRQFTVTQSWAIRVKPDDAAKTLNTAINAGANESGWIYWMIQDTGPVKARAAAQALAQARIIAEQIAQRSGVRLLRLFSANEVDGANGIYVSSAAPSAGGVGGSIGGINETAPLAITSRRIEVAVTISAAFAIE